MPPSTGLPSPGHVILQPHTLASMIDRGDDVLLLDVRRSTPGMPRAKYEAGHLPGAHHMPARHVLLGDTSSRLVLPDPAELQTALRDLGVREGTLVLAHGGHKGLEAGRLVWLLEWAGHRNTALLDGGFEAWWRAGLPTETFEFHPCRTGDVSLTSTPALACEHSQAAELAASGQAIDVRPRSRFTAACLATGATNMPSTRFTDPAGRVLDPTSLRNLLRRAGVDPGSRFAVLCDDGTASAWVAWVLRRAGCDAVLQVAPPVSSLQ